LSDLRFTRR